MSFINRNILILDRTHNPNNYTQNEKNLNFFKLPGYRLVHE